MIKERAERRYVGGLLLLSASTGALDAISYLALDQVFTGNMTGNVLFVAFAAAGADSLPLVNLVCALACFILGAAMVSLALKLPDRSGTRLPVVSIWAVGAATIVTAAVASCWALSGSTESSFLLVITGILAFVLGAQASGLRPLGIRDVNTVVVTMTLVGLAADGPMAGRRDPQWQRRLSAIAAMGTGALGGALVVDWLSGAAATFTASAVMAAGTIVLLTDRRSEVRTKAANQLRSKTPQLQMTSGD